MKNNKLIAEFMWFTSEKNIGWYDNNMMIKDQIYDDPKQRNTCVAKLVRKHSSVMFWDLIQIYYTSCEESYIRDDALNLELSVEIVNVLETEETIVQ